MKKPFHKQTKRVLTFGVLIFVALLVVTAGAVYMLKQKEYSVREKMATVRTLEAQSRQTQEARHSLTQTTDQQQVINRYLITEDNVVGFIEGLEALAGRVGVVLTLHNVQESKLGDYDSLTVTYSAQGSWSEAVSFLAASEVLPASVVIDSAWLRKVGTEEGELWALDMTISILGFNRNVNL